MADPGKGGRLPSIRRWPVRWRLAGVSAGLTLLILVVFALVVGRLATDRIKDDFRQELLSVGSQVRANIRLDRNPGEGIASPNLAELALTGDASVSVVRADGLLIGSTASNPPLAPPTAGVSRVGEFDVYTQPLDPETIAGQVMFVQYARSRSTLEDTLSELWLFLGVGVAGGTILAALAGLAVARQALRPISSLTAAARGIATTRDPSRRIPMPASDDEVAELATTLDEMLRELDAARAETQQMIQAQRDFVADASHELRTPLTSILANLELLEAGLAERGADAEEEEIVAGALGSSRRMRRLVGDLLLLARADAGRAGPRRNCDLVRIAGEAVAEVRPVAGAHHLDLDAEGPVTIDCNPDDLHRLVVSLVENGVRHTPAGTTVTVEVRPEGGADAVLEVSDDGPGLPEELGEQIFSRFVRGTGPADLTTDAGTGLGLAIVKAVATSHGGRVEVGRSDAGGARFAVRLPLAAPAPSGTPVL